MRQNSVSRRAALPSRLTFRLADHDVLHFAAVHAAMLRHKHRIAASHTDVLRYALRVAAEALV